MISLSYIIVFGLLMSLIALVGSVTLFLTKSQFDRIILPLVSLAAGTLIGGAVFHLLPEAIGILGNHLSVYRSLAIGFLVFFVLEQYLHWHHCHLSVLEHEPVSYLILVADGLHNFIGGITVGTAFVIDIQLGIVIWLVAAAHEIPQELGDFGILIHSGWSKKKALFFNFISALTFPIGGVTAYLLATKVDVSIILPFAAGNFLYIGIADLLPKLKGEKLSEQIEHFVIFSLGLAFMYLIAYLNH